MSEWEDWGIAPRRNPDDADEIRALKGTRGC